MTTQRADGDQAIRLSNADYARAEQMLAPNRRRRLPESVVTPQWLAKGSRFAYQVGGRFVVVDPAAGTRRDAFDHERLAAALSRASGHAVEATDLPITKLDLEVPDSDVAVHFSAFDRRWAWSDRSGNCVEVDDDAVGPGEVVSPDRAWVAFRRDGNIWVRSRDGGEEHALTDDAQTYVDYGGMLDAPGARRLLDSLGIDPADVAWSPDSTRLLTHRIDQRELPEQVLVESAPPGGGRPVEHRRRYPIPGDEAVATMSRVVLDVATRSVVHEQGDPTPMVHATSLIYRWWQGDEGRAVHFLRPSRDARRLDLVRLDPATGETTTLVTETTRTRVDIAPVLGDPALVRVLDSGEILWWSQRDGWGHLYRYSPDGADVTQLTSGPWVVRSLLWVDQVRRRVFFVATGLVADDPYVRQLCRIDLDGTGFTRLTDDDLDHDAVSPPEGGYLLDRASSPSRPPRATVRGGDGQVLVELEAPTADALGALGWTPPERFRVTAADGKTPIYGLLWRPYGFDPQAVDAGRRYPVIEHVYGGPQIHHVGPAFDSSHVGEPEALAALGFAVVAVDGRGTAGRSKAFQDHSYGDLGSVSLDDHVAAIRELAHRRPWLDLDRVGITGHSGGGFATVRALLAYPEFYRVGVAVAGNHDPGVYVAMWAEQYHGEIDDEARRAMSNVVLADRLEGKLLLIHGELDDNVLPSQTLRLVDALITADKDVDMLLVPGAEHALFFRKHHVVRRTWDYFVRHLHGSEPPTHRLAPRSTTPDMGS